MTQAILLDANGRKALCESIRALHARGQGPSAIADLLGVAEDEVRRVINSAPELPKHRWNAGDSKLAKPVVKPRPAPAFSEPKMAPGLTLARLMGRR